MKMTIRKRIHASKDVTLSGRKVNPSNSLKYKGFLIKKNRFGESYDIYDKHQELEDYGFKSVEDAKDWVDEYTRIYIDPVEDYKNIKGESTNIYSSEEEYGEGWILLDTKQVPDIDGFLTDYTIYTNEDQTCFICVFGDKDLYGPDDPDAEFDNYDEAMEWFESYNGFEDDSDDVYSSSSTNLY